MAEQIEFHEAGDWAAIYVDGELASGPGDVYNRYEWLLDHFGVTYVPDDAYLRGDNRGGNVARTLEELYAYREERDGKLARAAELRAEADRLEAEAERLRAEAG